MLRFYETRPQLRHPSRKPSPRSMTRLHFTVLLVAFVLNPFVGSPAAQAELKLQSGDRVVFLGDGLMEQEQYHGWIEVMLTTSFPDADITFRNLGWNADTPAGDSRYGLSLVQAGYEKPDEAWKQLVGQLESTNPSVLILGYGMAAALEASDAKIGGGEGAVAQELGQFAKDYQRLLETVRAKNPKTRFVLLSPLKPLGASMLDDQTVESVSEIISEVAADFGGEYIDLQKVARKPPHRIDPIHLSSEGYRVLATAIGRSLKLPKSDWKSSRYTESLREVILEKNRWWFHRSRPANMAYVFGFRKREQGQNAVEIPQFDALIAKEEKQIARLRSLRPSSIPAPPKRVKSKFAEFTPQPHPDFTVAENLEVSLWAENPLLNKPIHMNFDPEGRLWVASSEAYPMIEVGQSPPDKILVLEDTTGDGVADQSTVFADGLLIPTGVLPGDGGVYVAQSTDLLFLKDTDGDGVADQRERVLSGFGTEDTHHNLHTLLWGKDGRLYMNQSVYTRTDTETPYGVVRLKAGGGFRYSTQLGRMQTFFNGLWNPWGHQFDAHGNSFMTDGAGFAGIAYVFPGARFNPTPGARRVLDLISPGKYPKFCGGEIIYGDSYPDEWQGTMVTCDFRANRVTRFKLIEQDAGFVTEQAEDLIRTSQSSFRPIDVKQGPDGALYVADWSNPIINHGEVDFRDPRRDRWHGRIWRIAVKDAAKQTKTNLRQLDNQTLLGNLISGNRYTTDQSRRVLTERGDSILDDLATWLAKQKSDAAKLQGLWLSQSVGEINVTLLKELLRSDDGAIRTAAVRVLSDWADPQSPREASVDKITRADAMQLYQACINDDHPRVRLEAVRGLALLGSVDAAEQSLDALNHPMDRFIEYALYLTVNEYSGQLIDRMGSAAWVQKTPGGQNKLEFVLTSIPPNEATQFLSDYLAANKISRGGEGPWIELIGRAGGKEQLATLYRQVTSGGFDSSATVRALAALSAAQRQRKLRGMPAGSKPFSELKPLIESDDLEISRAAIDLVGDWKVGGAIQAIARLAGRSDANESIRKASIDALRKIGNEPAASALMSLADSSQTVSIRTAAVSALAGLGTARAAKPFFELLGEIKEEATAVSLWRSMLSGKDSESALVGAVPKSISQLAARAGVRAAREGGRNAESLAEVLLPMTGLTMTAEDWSPEKIGEITALVGSQGDPLRGEMIYHREKLQCSTCHAIGGIGGKVGPDMTSLGASAPIDYIIESMYDPNAKIKENFHSVMILTEDGQVITGIESGSSADEIVLRDASNKVIRIPDADVLEKKAGKSLMPAGLLDRVTQQDQIDLISFLTQLGKPGPFDASRQNVARRVDALGGNHRLEQEGIEDVIAGKPVPKGRSFAQWNPLQVRISGEIGRQQIQEATKTSFNISLVNVYLRTAIEASSATDATITVAGAKSAKCWIDGKRIDAGDAENQFLTRVESGKHMLVIQLDARQIPENVSLTSDDFAFIGELQD